MISYITNTHCWELFNTSWRILSAA